MTPEATTYTSPVPTPAETVFIPAPATASPNEGFEEAEVVTMVDEDGKNHDFEVVDVIEVDGKEYALLLPHPAPESSEDDEVLVLRFVEDADEPFQLIEDDAEFQKVVQVLEATNGDDGEAELSGM